MWEVENAGLSEIAAVVRTDGTALVVAGCGDSGFKGGFMQRTGCGNIMTSREFLEGYKWHGFIGVGRYDLANQQYVAELRRRIAADGRYPRLKLLRFLEKYAGLPTVAIDIAGGDDEELHSVVDKLRWMGYRVVVCWVLAVCPVANCPAVSWNSYECWRKEQLYHSLDLWLKNLDLGSETERTQVAETWLVFADGGGGCMFECEKVGQNAAGQLAPTRELLEKIARKKSLAASKA